MELKNSNNGYGLVSIVLHWLMAVAILGMFALGLYMVNLTYMDSWYKTAPDIHKSVGMVLFLLLIFRLFWRLSNALPEILGNPIEKKIALLVHRMHYVFMFTLMVSGYLITTADGRGIEIFGSFEFPALFPAEKGREDSAGWVHMLLAWAFLAFVMLHALAALKHHFIDKDRTLLRMLRVRKKEEK